MTLSDPDTQEAASPALGPSLSVRSYRTARSLVTTREFGIGGIAAVLFVILSLTAHNFLTTENLANVGQQISMLGIVAVGMTFVIVSAEIDLSAGSMAYFLGIVMAEFLFTYHWTWWVAAIAVLGIGVGFGFLNGAMTTGLRMPSFIVTLGMLSVFDGLSNVLTGGFPVEGRVPAVYTNLANAYLGGQLPVQVLWFAGAVIIGALVLARSRFGYHVYATGGNRLAARRVGIRTVRVKIACFGLVGFLAALVAVIEVGWFQSMSPTPGASFTLQIIAAVIIGGVNLFGGEGSVVGMLFGAIIIGFISDGLVLLNVSAYWETVAQGGIIIVAVASGTLLRARSQGVSVAKALKGLGADLHAWTARRPAWVTAQRTLGSPPPVGPEPADLTPTGSADDGSRL